MRIGIEPSDPPTGPAETVQHAVVLEHPYDDLTADEVVGMFYGAMVAFGFHPNSVVTAMQDVAEEHASPAPVEPVTEDTDWGPL